MSKRKYEYIERMVDSNGIERVYGYTTDGLKYFLNLRDVMREYERRGIEGFRVAV